MEEAARLFYVGMTRAKVNLQMISYKERDGEKTSESRFISDVRNILNPPEQRAENKRAAGQGKPVGEQSKQTAASRQGANNQRASRQQAAANPNAVRDRSDLAKGLSVKHRVFGSGTISALTHKEISIRFTVGVKTFALETCLEMGLLELV